MYRRTLMHVGVKALVRGALGLVVVGTIVSPSGATVLPDGRGYELVSPSAGKNGADVLGDSMRTRAAANGDAVAFPSLRAFGDAVGTGISVDYVAIRSGNSSPGNSGWSTHAITPPQQPLSFNGAATSDPGYLGDFSDDLTSGVFAAWSPVTDDLGVAATANLYVRNNLLTPGAGTYRLVTRCPLCDFAGTPLPPLPRPRFLPGYAGASNDFRHVAIESQYRLTADAPVTGGPNVYTWDDGQLSFAGYVPAGSDVTCGGGGPACVPAAFSIAGTAQTVGSAFRPVHVMSSNGARLFFALPTDGSGIPSPFALGGRLYVRTSNSTTDELTASERTDCAGDPTCGGDGVPDPAPASYEVARYWGASVDGSRVFFTSAQALTDDAPFTGDQKLYEYDTTRAASDPHNLTLLNVDSETDGGADVSNDVQGVIALSDDGHYVYFVATGQLVAGEQPLGTARGIYMWHDGQLTYIGRMVVNETAEFLVTGSNFRLNPPQARATPDGRYLLLSAHNGSGFSVGYDHGSCLSNFGTGCRELYVFSADTHTLVCASCNPSGAPATADAASGIRSTAVAVTTWHFNRAISDDGRRVFFTSKEALVSEDTNDALDVYEYTVTTGQVHLITSGTEPSNAYFMDASPSGDNVFFVTRERLVGWDTDTSYDLYDARVGGGFPDPVPPKPGCSGSACQGSPAPAASGSQIASAAIGAGDLAVRLKPHPKPCRKGYVKRRVRGRRKCVKQKSRHARRDGSGHRRGGK